MRHLTLMITAAACLVPGCATLPAGSQAVTLQSPQAAVDEILATDRAFAANAAQADLVSGIAAMFDEQVVMPAPPPGQFVVGKAAAVAALRSNPANANAKANWAPVRGGVSADGNHGFTIGFMEITEAGKPDRRAKYLSYWIRRPEGWRIAVYKRSGRPEGEISRAMMDPSLPSLALRPARDAATLETWRLSLDHAERAFSDDAQRIGIGPAFVKHGSSDATNMGGGAGFVVGNDKIGADVGGGEVGAGPTVKWAPDGGTIVASTGDLGVTWGTIHAPGPPVEGRPSTVPYITVWRRASPDQPWKYIAE